MLKPTVKDQKAIPSISKTNGEETLQNDLHKFCLDAKIKNGINNKENIIMKFELPKLAYNFDALEPIMDATTVEIHYTKHHQAYVNNLNAAIEKYDELQDISLEELLLNISDLPKDIQATVRNNGGGHYNHTQFWAMLTPNQNQEPSGELLHAIEHYFGSVQAFQAAFEGAGLKHFGSGWVWLMKAPNGELKIITLPNQDAPLSFGVPLLGIDLWEHAYYLKHQNKRADYLKNIWGIVNWRYVEALFAN